MNKRAEILHQSLAVMTVALNELVLGMGIGWIAPVLANAELILTPDESSWIASMEHLGEIFGVLLASQLLDLIGRKRVLIMSALPFFFIWPATLCTRLALVICLLRFIFGFAIGLNDGANSMYLGEVSSPIVRSIFGSIASTMSFSGVLLEYIIATYLSYVNTAIVNAIITFLALFAIFWLVEPPQYLLMKGRDEQALANFMWLKGATDPEDVQIEFEKIKQNARKENQMQLLSFKKMIAVPANYKSMLIVCILYSLNGAAGYFPITSYASFIFSSTSNLSSNEFTILFGISQLVVVLSTSFINKRYNRRPVLLISFALAAFTLSGVAALCYVHQYVMQISNFSWIIFACITGYASIYAFMYPTIFLIRAELFPLSVKAIGGAISLTGMSATSFLMTKIFMYFYLKYGMYSNFLIFAVINLVGVVFVYVVLPETKNKSLVEIQEQLEKQK